jgi:hypothetical protein
MTKALKRCSVKALKRELQRGAGDGNWELKIEN